MGVWGNYGKEVLKEIRSRTQVLTLQESTGAEQDKWKKILMKVYSIKEKENISKLPKKSPYEGTRLSNIGC